MKSLWLTTLLIFAIDPAAAEPLDLREGFAADRLEIRESDGSLIGYVERTLGGRLVIRERDGRVRGEIRENDYRGNRARSSRRGGSASERHSLPEHWSQD